MNKRDRELRRSVLSRRRALALLLAASVGLGSLAGSGCIGGYHLGPDGLYSSEIKTVYVPMVEAGTYREAFGERLTEAIVKKVSEQTPYRIAGPEHPDSTLTVTLTGETQRVSALNRYDDTRQKNVELTATVVWRNNLTGGSPNDALSRESGATIVAQSFLVPEMGQSTATSQQEAIDNLAEQIVGLMENAW